MISDKGKGWIIFLILEISLALISCSLVTGFGSKPSPEATATPTPIMIAGSEIETPESTSRCDGLSGSLEAQLLVGPADAVGLEPLAVGEIPFSVVSSGEPYSVEGANSIEYDDVLIEEWGTYTVSFNMDVTFYGECSGAEGAEQLTGEVTMSGNQMVEVEAEGFQGEYPWNGTQEITLAFPLQEGATMSGEGWQFVLHLDQ